ncbi:MAG: hypothetical protein EKK63_11395 [Acinetobacter sp.]|jgi:hypothetical protein|uniref:hypothetical protein n=1 Tax=Acinetobacter sp. TaxID=472 RepID=UPI000F92A1CF|nr:hypothetical protein [Acinetobacter sp.]RUP38817.1 MAG: hypothetical protein EKK63_11395 [Acinetobacter sp.]
MTTLSLADTVQLQQLIFFVFAVGVFVGAICTGFLTTLKNLVFYHFDQPTRIRTNNGYLYRFRNKYVPLAERQNLMKQAIEQHRALKNGK